MTAHRAVLARRAAVLGRGGDEGIRVIGLAWRVVRRGAAPAADGLSASRLPLFQSWIEIPCRRGSRGAARACSSTNTRSAHSEHGRSRGHVQEGWVLCELGRARRVLQRSGNTGYYVRPTLSGARRCALWATLLQASLSKPRRTQQGLRRSRAGGERAGSVRLIRAMKVAV